MKAKSIALIVLFLFCGSVTYGQETLPPPGEPLVYTIKPASSKIHVDGVLDEPAWQEATRIELKYEWFPGNNTPAPVRTICLITYDKHNFYVAFIAEDQDPSAIRAHLMDRDQIEELVLDDYVGFMIDTFNDGRRAFQFRINPLGVQAEALNSDVERSENWNWDIIWESAGQLTQSGYTIEVAIPWKQLRFPRSEETMTWGFTAMRSWPREVRHRIRSSYTDYNRNCVVCQFDKITGIKGVKPGLNLELDPTLTTIRSDHREDFPEGPMIQGDIDPQFGISARWNPVSNVTFNGTVNPDFSQVEADSPQLEVNRRFALFFPEKRPFFLEGSDFFDVPNNLVFTRTITDPDFGIKLTAREGRHSMGFLAADDSINNLIIPSNQGSSLVSIAQSVFTSIGRYRFDIGQASSMGLIITDRRAEDYQNTVLGFDSLVRLTDSDSLTISLVGSRTDYPDENPAFEGQPDDAFYGHILSARYTHATRTWVWSGTVGYISPDFRADAGFVPQVDLRIMRGFIERNWWSDGKAWWTNLSVAVSYNRVDDHTGRLTSEELEFGFSFEGPLQSGFGLEFQKGREWFGGQIFQRDNVLMHFGMKPAGWVDFSLFALRGDAIDFTGGRPAEEFRFRPEIRLRPGRHINLQLSYNLQTLHILEGHLFTEQVMELKLFYHFSSRLFVRGILQYRDVRRSPERYSVEVQPRTNQLFLQFLGSYRINAQTVVLVGYADNYRGFTGIDLTETNRTFFVKIGYAFLF